MLELASVDRSNHGTECPAKSDDILNGRVIKTCKEIQYNIEFTIKIFKCMKENV